MSRLFGLGLHPRWEQPMDAKSLPLLDGERAALVQLGVLHVVEATDCPWSCLEAAGHQLGVSPDQRPGSCRGGGEL